MADRDPGRAYLYKQPPKPVQRQPSAKSGLQLQEQRIAPESSGATPLLSRTTSAQSAGTSRVAPGQAGPPINVGRTQSTPATSRAGSMDRYQVDGAAPPPSPIPRGGSRRMAGDPGAWRGDSALGNMSDARVALEVLAHALDDAVYLDEDAFSQAASTEKYLRTIQAQQRRIRELEHELDSALERLTASEALSSEREAKAKELEGELENNAVVFKMHYSELLAKDDEVAKLKAVIQGLSGR